MQRYGRRRVAITGLGVVSPIGQSLDDLWESLINGRSGIGPRVSGSTTSGQCVGQVRPFRGHIEDFGQLDSRVKKVIRKALRMMNRETQMAVAAGQQAIADSRFHDAEFDAQRVGVCFGADNVSMNPNDFLAGVNACRDDGGRFDFNRWGTDGLSEVAPLWLLKCLPNMPACYLAIFNNFTGPNNSITEGAVSANLAMAEAYRIIQEGDADVILTGATGTTLEPFNLMHTVVDELVADSNNPPHTICRPFDRRRSGSVLAEGAAALLLEELDSAVSRGAAIYGELIGTGSSCAVTPDGRAYCRQSAANALKLCLAQAELSAESVGHIHAHGLSTPKMDADEAQAIRDVFGSTTDCVPVVATKSNIGNAGAGAGGIELVSSLLALRRGRLFPVLNYEERDPECPISPVTSTERSPGESFLNLNIAPHGQASCIAVRAWECN